MHSCSKSNIIETKCMNYYSRQILLTWVNDTLSSNYQKIEELCSGVAYCQLLNIVFPGSVQVKKIKVAARLEHEFMENLKIFQLGFTKLKVNKLVPIDRLVKGRFLDNFEFLQWFKTFFDKNSHNELKESSVMALSPSPGSKQSKYVKISKPLTRSDTYDVFQQNGDNDKSVDVLLDTIMNLKKQIALRKQDRDYYFSKLKNIEVFLEEESITNKENPRIKICLDILYSEDEIILSPRKLIEDRISVIHSIQAPTWNI